MLCKATGAGEGSMLDAWLKGSSVRCSVKVGKDWHISAFVLKVNGRLQEFYTVFQSELEGIRQVRINRTW